MERFEKMRWRWNGMEIHKMMEENMCCMERKKIVGFEYMERSLCGVLGRSRWLIGMGGFLNGGRQAHHSLHGRHSGSDLARFGRICLGWRFFNFCFVCLFVHLCDFYCCNFCICDEAKMAEKD
jgi:hypothetical protein